MTSGACGFFRSLCCVLLCGEVEGDFSVPSRQERAAESSQLANSLFDFWLSDRACVRIHLLEANGYCE